MSHYDYMNASFHQDHSKRQHISQMIRLKNKIPSSDIFLVTYDTTEILSFYLENLREDTSNTKYKQILDTFNYITLENFNNPNPS